MSNQLIKTTELGKENVFPRTRILDLFDDTSGLKLIDILRSFNMMFVPYLGNKSYTRNQVSPELRRQGLWLTYVIDNTVYTEWYDEVAIDDTNWGSDSNWRQGSNALVGDLSISPNGTWVINGEDSGITIKGDKGDSPVIRIYDNKILVSYDKGITYEDLNNTPVYTKFRFNSLTNTYLVSYDLGTNWEDISDEKVYHKFKYNLVTNTYLESIDFGKTWSNISAEKVYTKFRFNRSTNTYQVSTDLGLNWTDVSSDKVYYQFRYNGETNTHLVSTDFGTTWTNVSEDKVFYLFRTNDNRLLVSTDLGNTWENCSEPIAAWFRWADVSGTGNIGKVLISRDNSTWEDLSPVMTNNLYIKGYVAAVGNLPSDAAIGDIYMVGPTYDESDTTLDYPHYRMWIKLSSEWVDNGEYLSNVLISLTTGLETGITMSLKAITDEIDKKFDKEKVTLEFGDSEEKVVSQFALPFRYIQNDEFIFAKVDGEDKILFGIQWDGTPVFGKTSAVEDRLQAQVNLLADKITTILGDDDTTNAIDTLKELKDFFANIDNTQTLTSILANLNSVSTKLGEDIKKLQDTKVDKEEGKSLIENEVKECFMIIENEEFLKAIVDSEDRVLFGIYRATGKPYYPQNDMYHISQSEEFLWVILDAANHPLLGIQQDGTCWAAKAQWLDDIKAIKNALSSIDETLKTFQPKEDGKGLMNLDIADSFFYISNDEYIIAVVDVENRILAGIKYDGEPYFPNHEMYSVITNEEWLYVIIDAEDKVLCGFRADNGRMIVGSMDISTFIANTIIDIEDIKERTSHLSTIENDEYLSVETDAEGKVIGYIAPDGSHYLYNVKSETIDNKVDKEEGKNLVDKYWADSKTTLEDKDNYMATIDKEGKYLSYVTKNGSHYFHNVESETIDDLNDRIDDVYSNIINNDPSSYCDTGNGTFEEPYQSKDGTAGINNSINNNSRGHRILFDDKNYLLTSSVTLSGDPKMFEGKTMGYQNNPLGIKHSIAGSVLTLGNENAHINIIDSHGIHLKKLGLYGINTKEFASREDDLFDPNNPEKNSAINVIGYSDQNLLRDLCIITRGAGIVAKNGCFDCSIIDHINFDGCNVGIWLDFANMRYSIHSRILNCIFADMPSMAIYIKDWEWGFFEGNHLSHTSGIISEAIAQKVGCKAAMYINAHGSQIKNNTLRAPGTTGSRIFKDESEEDAIERECIGLAVCGDFNNIQGNIIRNAQKYALWVKGNKNTIIGNMIETSQQDGMNLDISESIVDGNLINIKNGGKSMIINGNGNIIQNNIGNTELIINGSNNLIGINSFSNIIDNGINNKFLNI